MRRLMTSCTQLNSISSKKSILANRPFPSSLVPQFQSESNCENILMKTTLVCKKMKLNGELIFT